MLGSALASLLAFVAPHVPPPLAPLPHHPHDIIDCVELSPQYGRDHTLFATSEGTINLVVRSRDRGHTWRDVRAGITGRHVHSMALAPDFALSGKAWAAVGLEGLVASTDGGTSWTMLPFDGDARLVAVGKATPGERGGAPLYVGDRSGLWQMRGDGSAARKVSGDLFKGNPPTELAIAGDGTLFLATEDGALWRSRDQGDTFTRLCKIPNVRAIAPSPAYGADKTLFLATFGQGVLVSRNRGATFEPLNAGLDDPFVNDLAIPQRWPECQELFAVTKDAGLFRTVDGGKSWKLTPFAVLEKTYQTENHHLHVRLAADYPATPDVVVGTFEGLFVSRDRGQTFTKSNINPTRIGRRLALSPDFATDRTLFTSGYGMLLAISGDAGGKWEFDARGVHALSTYALAVAPNWRDEGLIVLGINEGIWRTRDRGATWARLELPPFARPSGPRQDHDIFQFVFSPDFARDRTCVGVSFGGVFVSHDAAETFQVTAPPAPWLKAVGISPAFAEDQTLFVGGGGLHRSKDGGKSFGGELLDASIDGITPLPDFATSKQVFAVSRASGIYRSDDGGDHWRPANEGLGDHRPTQMQCAVEADGKVTLIVATLGAGLHASRDRGATWQPLGTRDPQTQCLLSVAVSPAWKDDGTLFVGNFDGVWRSRDRGEHFELTTRSEIYDDDREPWLRRGKWEHMGRDGAFYAAATYSRQRGAEMELPFVGDGVKLLLTRGPDHGIAKLLLDDQEVATFDGYAAQPGNGGVAWEVAQLPFGFHRLVVRVAGERNAAATANFVGVDGGEVSCTDPKLLTPK